VTARTYGYIERDGRVAVFSHGDPDAAFNCVSHISRRRQAALFRRWRPLRRSLTGGSDVRVTM
jgi:hypothetical protein